MLSAAVTVSALAAVHSALGWYCVPIGQRSKRGIQAPRRASPPIVGAPFHCRAATMVRQAGLPGRMGVLALQSVDFADFGFDFWPLAARHGLQAMCAPIGRGGHCGRLKELAARAWRLLRLPPS